MKLVFQIFITIFTLILITLISSTTVIAYPKVKPEGSKPIARIELDGIRWEHQGTYNFGDMVYARYSYVYYGCIDFKDGIKKFQYVFRGFVPLSAINDTQTADAIYKNKVAPYKNKAEYKNPDYIVNTPEMVIVSIRVDSDLIMIAVKKNSTGFYIQDYNLTQEEYEDDEPRQATPDEIRKWTTLMTETMNNIKDKNDWIPN